MRTILMGFTSLFFLILAVGVFGAFVKFFRMGTDSKGKRFLGVILLVFTICVFLLFVFEFALVLSVSDSDKIWLLIATAFLITGPLVVLAQMIGRRIWTIGVGKTVMIFTINVLSVIIATPVLYVLYMYLTRY